MPDQPLGAVDGLLDRFALHRVDELAAKHRSLRCLELHRDVKPVKDPASGKPAALNGLVELASVVADHGHSLVGFHATAGEELIQPRSRRGNLLMHVGVEARSAISERGTSCNDVDVPLLDQFLGPWGHQLGPGTRSLTALGAAAEMQPRRIHPDAADAGRFAKLRVGGGSWPGRDLALDLRVECFADGEDPAPGAADRNPIVQRKDLPKYSGLPIGKMGGSLGLQVLQFRSDSPRHRLAQRTHGAAWLSLL